MLFSGEEIGSGFGFGWGTSALARWMILGLPGWFLRIWPESLSFLAYRLAPSRWTKDNVHMRMYSKGNGRVSRRLIVSSTHSRSRGTDYVSSYVSKHQLTSKPGKRGLTCKSLVLEMVALQTSHIAQVSFFS
jgi:hypothetical protein